MDLYQPQGVGRRKRKAQNNEDGSVVSEQTIISPVRQKRSDGYDRDRQKTLSLAEGGRGTGEAIFMREDRIITEKPRRNFYPIPLDPYTEKRNNDRKLPGQKHHEEADINENVSFTVIIPEGIPFDVIVCITCYIISFLQEEKIVMTYFDIYILNR